MNTTCESKAGKQASKQAKQAFRRQGKQKPVPLLLTILQRGRQATREQISEQRAWQ
jgi:hypothetical protein